MLSSVRIAGASCEEAGDSGGGAAAGIGAARRVRFNVVIAELVRKLSGNRRQSLLIARAGGRNSVVTRQS